MIQKTKIYTFTHAGKCWYYEEPPYPGHFYNKGRYLWRHVAASNYFVSSVSLGLEINLSHEIFFTKGHFYDEGRYIRRNVAASIEWDCVLN